MAHSVIMPKFGLAMTTAQVTAWLVDEGARVQKGQTLAEIESDKATLQLECPADGILGRIVVPSGQQVPAGEVIAWVVAPGEAVPDAEPHGVASPARGTRAAPQLAATSEVRKERSARSGRVRATPRAKKVAREMGVDLSLVAGSGPGGRISAPDVEAHVAASKTTRAKASPLARKLAEDAGLDLASVTGSGPGGRVTREDVENALATRQAPTLLGAEPPAVQLTTTSGIRRTIAERLSASHTTTARVTLFTEVDATALVDWRESLKTQAAIRGDDPPSYNDLLIRITAAALREYPYMNASWSDEGARQRAEVNVGLATDTERGLLVPVVQSADRKTIWEIAEDVRSLVSRARDGTITPEEMHGGTFTLTNLGMYGIDGFTPIINLPECAILGVGRIAAQPAVWRGQICIRKRMVLSLTFDHRVVDGAPAARFLERLAQLAEAPHLLL